MISVIIVNEAVTKGKPEKLGLERGLTGSIFKPEIFLLFLNTVSYH